MRCAFRLIVCALVAVAGPATADITANYIDPNSGLTESIEIASNGDIRIAGSIPGFPSNPNRYLLRHDGQTYDIWPSPKGPVVIHAEEFFAVVAEQREEMLKEHPLPESVEELKSKGNPWPPLKKGEVVIIRGRAGTTYRRVFRILDKVVEMKSEQLVISNDPSLKLLSDAAIFQNEYSADLLGPGAKDLNSGRIEILKTGAPLKYGRMELDTVKLDSISPQRFALPAEPLSHEEARKFLTPRGQQRESGPAK